MPRKDKPKRRNYPVFLAYGILFLTTLGYFSLKYLYDPQPLNINQVAQSNTTSASTKLVGVYQGAPGTLPVILGNGNKSWVTNFPEHPTLGKYDTASDKYINWSLDKMADIGIDFVILDESNGIHLIAGNGQRVLEAALVRYLDIVDARIAKGIKTPKITLMTPLIGIGDSCGAQQQGKQDGCLIGELDWIWLRLVNKEGKPRPGWFWLDGKPFIGIYSVRPFTPTYKDNRYTVRHICNAQSNECHQPQKELGNVWFWSTRNENGPLSAPRSEQMTIQNGFDNKIACQIWGLGKDPKCLIHEGFTQAYYNKQWDTAIGEKPRIIVISNFGGGAGIEGGQIEQRVDFNPPTLYEDITKKRIREWKQL